jgi:hypothetical protein
MVTIVSCDQRTDKGTDDGEDLNMSCKELWTVWLD